MAKIKDKNLGLSEAKVANFIRDGYVRIDNAFPRRLATQARARMWRDTGCNPNDSSTWTHPVIRLWVYWQKPFREAANTPILHRAFNQLVGKNRWLPREALGTFVVRFPSDEDPGDTGWHVDSSFPRPEFEGVPNEETDFRKWRVNITSRGRALLMLFLFSDVSENDAPTRIRVGSHMDIARLLAPDGEPGIVGIEMDFSVSEGHPEVLAIGTAGTVYLCHPFLVHAAQPHRGSTPRFLAQTERKPAVPMSILLILI
jgi:Phytanoyl-CoA dioxygenase (PhyH)